MGEFRFANPEWLHACWIVILLAGVLVWLELRGRSLLDRFISPLMQQRLVHKPKLLRRLVAIGLFCASLLCLVFGLMRPQWGMTVQAMTRVDSQIMICLDVSKSMLAEDVVPNRLDRAKAEIDSLLGLMDSGQQVGLIAFAGRASVLCPMTTDFGFLRLILAEVSPGSIGRGGTRIGEALTKAADGFRTEGDVNRLILLITDGEDHDSFPLDAAEKAKEKGVRVVSIGFGDESGSKIAITDPATGAREFVKDRAGNDVVSRLDGETLREIALNTEGVYIPAGTGALDLQSIYDAHIKSLMRGTDTGEERIIRNEGYQWFAIISLILLLSSMALRAVQSVPSRTRAAMAVFALLLGPGVISTAQAQSSGSATAASNSNEVVTAKKPNADDKASMPPSQESDTPTTEDASLAESTIKEIEQPPRELYNRGIRLISSNPDRAEKLLSAARNKAGVDGELRFRALYNLGWVEVTRGDRFVTDQPTEAIKHFELAAGRFREAIRLRPESEDARHNLEIIARRILELQDAIAQADGTSLEDELDLLIESQRAHQAELQELTALMAPGTIEPGELRSTFRNLGVTQRKIISDAERLGQSAKREIDKLKSDPQTSNAAPSQAAAGLTPEQMEQMNAYRAAQITAMLAYLDRSTQRMAKARSFTRRAQPQRAFARWSAALTETKRARDQLRNPIEVLGVLIQDASELRQLTQVMVQTSSPIVSLESQDPSNTGADQSNTLEQAIDDRNSDATTPAWLTDELLIDSQTTISERMAELASILEAAVREEPSEKSGQGAPSGDDMTGASPPENAESQQILENIRGGLPFILEARKQFENADTEMQKREYVQAVFHQNQAIDSLMEASEYFYDLRRMIELIFREQKELQALCMVYGPDSSINDPLDAPAIRDLDVQAIRDSLSPQALGQLLQSATETQAKNQTRLMRLNNLITAERSKLEAELQTQSNVPNSPSTPPSATGQSAAGESADKDPRIQRFDIAAMLCKGIGEDFTESQLAFKSVMEQAATLESKAELPSTTQSTNNSDDRNATDESKPTGESRATDVPESTSESKAADEPNSTQEPNTAEASGEDTLDEEDESVTKIAEESPDSDTFGNAATPALTDDLPRDAVDRSVEKLEELLRLFFSLIEYLRDTTRRQAELGDRTLALLGDLNDDSDADARFAARIAVRQEQLQETATQIATALGEQAQQAGQAASQGIPGRATPAPPSVGQAGDGETLEQAAQLVNEGAAAMQEALKGLGEVKSTSLPSAQTEQESSKADERLDSASNVKASGASSPDEPTNATDAEGDNDSNSREVPEASTALDSKTRQEDKLTQERNEAAAEVRKSTIFDPQSVAFQKLLEALQLLDNQQSNDNSQNQDQNQDQQESDSQDSEQSQPPESNASRDMNSAQMLQAIRDREAKRREEKNKSQAASNGGVEKDW